MAPSASTAQLPPSVLQKSLDASKTTIRDSPHLAYHHYLASTILHDLQYQHDWVSLSVHTHSTRTNSPLPRPIISGLPPRRAYIHPDEQVEILKAEQVAGESIEQRPEREWVLPTHVQETWSLAKFAVVFDALDTVPPTSDGTVDEGLDGVVGTKWQGKNRQKRLMLAALHDDSTIVYYIMHDGIVKPRQN